MLPPAGVKLTRAGAHAPSNVKSGIPRQAVVWVCGAGGGQRRRGRDDHD